MNFQEMWTIAQETDYQILLVIWIIIWIREF